MPASDPNNLFDPTAATPSSKISDASIQALVPTDSAAKQQPIYGQDQQVQVNPSQHPEDVVSIPPVAAVFQGKPAAAYATKADAENPVVQEIGSKMHDIMTIGLSLYRGYNDDYVLFNPKHIQGAKIRTADKAGDLDSVATHILDLIPENYNPGDPMPGSPPPTEGPGAASQSPGGQPSDQRVPSQPPPAMPARPAPASGGAQSDLMNARLRNLLPSTPTAGPSPGHGAILNRLLRPAV